MNYRHAYHAGNFADVVKHACLVVLMQRLAAKDKPFTVVDTHAGIGIYDLDGPEAGKTLEWREGIGRLLDLEAPPAPLGPYLSAVTKTAEGRPGLRYPGSPAVVRNFMRADDRLILCELHPDDAVALRRFRAGDPRIAVHRRDGWEALKALLPPRPRRGLALIDPPYEEPGEARRVVPAVTQAMRRWPQGIVAVWYPIKGEDERALLARELGDAALPSLVVAELAIHRDLFPARLNGSGLAIAGAPWRIEEEMEAVLAALHPLLDRTGGTYSVRRLTE